MKKSTIILSCLALLVIGFIVKMQSPDSKSIRLVTLGDSYTIGEGVEESGRWPNRVVDHLQQEGIAVALVANPSVTGFTTQDVMEYELPILRRSNADIVTVLIGANDYFQGVEKEVFQKNLQNVLDEIQTIIKNERNIVLITIPDYSKTPAGKSFGDTQTVSEGITSFNEVIKDEGKKRNIVVIDIFAISQKAETDLSLVATDGLHPSSRQYAQWEELIFPVIKKIVTDSDI